MLASHPRARNVLRARSLAVAITAALACPAALAAGIHLNVGTLDTTQMAPSAAAAEFEGKRLHLVQFEGPIKGEWVDALAADGLQVLDYLPDYAYLVYGDAAALARMQSRMSRGESTGIVWNGAWLAEYKIHPSTWQDAKQADVPLAQRATSTDRFSIQLVADPVANAATRARLSALGGQMFGDPGAIPGRVNLNVALDPSGLALLASHPDVVSIHPWVEPVRFDERQNLIMAGELTGNAPTPGDYFARLTAWGFTQAQFNASGFVVDVTDDGADRNPTGAAPGTIPQDSNAGPVPANHFVLWESGNRPIGATTPTGTSRFVYKGRWGTGSTTDGGQGLSGHGQLNMSIVGGFVPTGTVGGVNFGAFPHADASGFRFGLGVAPFVRMANSVIFDPNYTNPNFSNMLSAGYTSGMRISSNSWGSNAAGAYDSSSQTYDGLVRDAQSGAPGNQETVIVFSAGNSGAGANTIGSPGTGKNVITVGAAENVHPFGGADGCGIADTGADNANDIISFSSRGPTDDGRFKPDIQAPGTHITGMAYVTPESTGNGTAVPGFDASGVCAGVPPSDFFPNGQAWYTASSGTSHSAPAVAGGAALIRQQFINNPSYLSANRTPAGANPPSPAMTKAYMVNSARYMTGVSANDTLPSQSQGMGMINLGTAFDGTPRILRDQAPIDTFTDTGQSRTVVATVLDASKPVRVTLAWTDAPGTTAGNAFVNNLDLRVSAGGNTYLGNVFNGATSTTGGTADPRNNVESVFLPPLPAGTPISVVVAATNIAGNGVPNDAGSDPTDQDYALVVSNAAPALVPVVANTANSLPTGNGLLEPNECNVLNVTLSNTGAAAATAVSATLSTTTPGVTIAQASSGYPNLAPGASAANIVPFQISTGPGVVCGSTVTINQTVTYTGGGSPAQFALTFPVGTPEGNYAFASTTGASIPAGGTLVAGSAVDDGVVTIAAPFALTVYGTSIAAGANITASTNGNLQFVGSGGSTAFTNAALPAGILPAAASLMPYWDDLDLRPSGSGIFTQVIGTAPNRQWIIEWRGKHFSDSAATTPNLNFAVVLTEGSSVVQYRYVTTGAGTGANAASATIGLQSGGADFRQFSFNTASITPGQVLTATRAPAVCQTGPGVCSLDPVFSHGFEPLPPAR